MSDLDKLLAPYIGGAKGEWYYQIEIGQHEVSGGYFYRIRDARLHLKVKLRSFFLDDTVIKEYLQLREAK